MALDMFLEENSRRDDITKFLNDAQDKIVADREAEAEQKPPYTIVIILRGCFDRIFY